VKTEFVSCNKVSANAVNFIDQGIRYMAKAINVVVCISCFTFWSICVFHLNLYYLVALITLYKTFNYGPVYSPSHMQ